jgi:hypothetical protein
LPRNPNFGFYTNTLSEHEATSPQQNQLPRCTLIGNTPLPSLWITSIYPQRKCSNSRFLEYRPLSLEIQKANKTIYWARVFGSMERKQGQRDNTARPGYILVGLLKEMWGSYVNKFLPNKNFKIFIYNRILRNRKPYVYSVFKSFYLMLDLRFSQR